MEIRYTRKFVKEFRRLPEEIRSIAVKKIEILKRDQRSPVLRTHKLSGELSDKWSFWVKYQYRIVFNYDGKAIVLLMIGTHEIYS